MKKLVVMGSLVFMMGMVTQGYCEDSRKDLPKIGLTQEEGMILSSLLILRVGSPVYNFLRDLDRSVSSYSEDGSGSSFLELAQKLRKLDQYENVRPNSLILIKGGKLYKGELSISSDFESFLVHERDGIFELLGESLTNGTILTLGRVIGQPIAASLSSIISDDSLSRRLNTDILAIGESSKAPVYAFLDVINKVKQTQISRSVKSMVRIPVSIADLGLVIGNKLITLPVHLMKSSLDSFVNGLSSHFQDDADDRDFIDLLVQLALEERLDKDHGPILEGVLEDQGFFIGRAGSHRLHVKMGGRTFLINVRSSKFYLNNYVGKKVSVRAEASGEKRLGLCCSIGFLFMIEDIQLSPQQ